MKEENTLIYVPEINGIPVILNTDLFPFYSILTNPAEQFPYYPSEDLITADGSDVTHRLLKEENCSRYLKKLENLEIVLIKDPKTFCDKWQIFELIEKGM